MTLAGKIRSEDMVWKVNDIRIDKTSPLPPSIPKDNQNFIGYFLLVTSVAVRFCSEAARKRRHSVSAHTTTRPIMIRVQLSIETFLPISVAMSN